MPQNARVPCGMLLEGVWLNLMFDVQSFIMNCFEPNFRFRSIDGITLGGACLVRRIATLKSQIPDSFVYVIEREFGQNYAQQFDNYCRECMQQRLIQIE
jgi:hypothetical protein